MEPNWKEQQSSWQDSGSMRTQQHSGAMRRPVADEGRAQRPLGAGRTRRDLPYQVRRPQDAPGQTAQGNHAGQTNPYAQTNPRFQTNPNFQTNPGQQTNPKFQTNPGFQPNPGQQPWQSAPPDPFDGYGEDPSLAQERSENLYDRERTFWHQFGDITSTQEQIKAAPRADKHVLRWVMLIVVVLAAVGFVVCGAVFRVRSVTVQGNSTISAEEVICLAGIHEGMSTLALDHDAIEQGLENNRYLSFVCVEVKLPDQVVIQVRERTAAAVIKYCGILYLADSRGMVLEESFDTDAAYPGLVAVDGLDIRQCEVGKQLIVSGSKQLDVYMSILLELKVMDAMDQVKELNLSDMDNLFLVSTDGYSVRLGESSSIHAKLRAMLLTLDKLREDGYGAGTVDVSTPVNPTYIPEES